MHIDDRSESYAAHRLPPSIQVRLEKRTDVGMVISGRATAAIDHRGIIEMKPGDIFSIEAGHDSWVIGDEPRFHDGRRLQIKSPHRAVSRSLPLVPCFEPFTAFQSGTQTHT